MGHGALLSSSAGAVVIVVYLAVIVIEIAALWQIFEKAGQPGWAAIIPIYNAYVLLKIVGRPVWWLLLFFIPLVNVIVEIVVANDLSKSFGRGVGFTVGLVLLGPIFIPILGFGSARYTGPAALQRYSAGRTMGYGMGPPAGGIPADWYADPTGGHQHRYWNGSAWTEHVADNGVQAVDPV